MPRIIEPLPLRRHIQIHTLRPSPRHLSVQRPAQSKRIIREAVKVDGEPGVEVGREEDVAASAAGGEVIAVAGGGAQGDGEDVGGVVGGGGRGGGPGCTVPVGVLGAVGVIVRGDAGDF